MTPGPSSAPFGAPDHVHTSQHPDAPDPSHSGPSSLANQPKTCTLCGQQLDAPTLDPDRGQEARSATSAASAPSPSSFAFAPDPIAGQSRHSLHSAINAAAAAALSRHLDNGETLESIVVTDADGNPICSRCAAAAVRDVASPGQAQEQSPEPPQNAADDDVEMTDGSSPDDGERLTGPPRPPHHWQSSVLQEVREEDSTESPTSDRNLGDAAADTPSSRSIAIPIHTPASTTSTTSTTAAAPASSTISPRRRTAPWAASSPSSRPSHDTPNLSISVTNMGTGGDAAMPNPTDESEFPPLGRPGTSPVLRSPTSPTRSPTNDRGRMRFGSPPRGMQVDDLHSTSPILGRSGSFSRSLSYSTSGSDAAVASTSTPVVSFPQSSNASTVVHGFSPAQPRGRRSSSSGSIHVPAPVGAIPGAGKTRRPSVTRRLSRSSSSTAPTSLPFAAMAASSADLPACPIEEDPFGPSAVSRPRISTIPTHAISDTLFGSTASLTGLNMSGSMFRDASRAIKVLPSPFSHPNTSDDSRDTADGAASGIRIDETRWYDPLKPDPLQEICRVRSPPKGRGCLFPGALFQGTQKSGRNSYDVTVRIVNVDLEASHLCGYLNIRGLTEDWPELTTYFDAEIIGDRHGFVTGKWGATEADDLKHWARFQPFRPLRSALTKPGLRFNHLNKPYVFMRWKERFLVPDHRVRDINGASFAGFYYVCVELGESGQRPPSERRSSASQDRSGTFERSNSGSNTRTGLTGASPPDSQAPHWYLARSNRRRERESQQQQYLSSISSALSTAAPSIWPPSPPNASTPADESSLDWEDIGTAGKMSGFYFHENSEPYQQLSLHHVPERSSGAFELR